MRYDAMDIFNIPVPGYDICVWARGPRARARSALHGRMDRQVSVASAMVLACELGLIVAATLSLLAGGCDAAEAVVGLDFMMGKPGPGDPPVQPVRNRVIRISFCVPGCLLL
eukprot:COSAG02_NODE_10806_length_1855_cov_1.687927_3_plen_112_part_00